MEKVSCKFFDIMKFLWMIVMFLENWGQPGRFGYNEISTEEVSGPILELIMLKMYQKAKNTQPHISINVDVYLKFQALIELEH